MLKRTILMTALASLGALATACTEPSSPVKAETLPPIAGTQAAPIAAPAAPVVRAGSVTPLPGASSLTLQIASSPASAFSISSLGDLVFTAHVYGLPATDDFGLELVEPDGTVYQRQLHALADSNGTPQDVSFTLPVSGTYITQHNLTGTWTAHLWALGAERTLQSFELTQ